MAEISEMFEDMGEGVKKVFKNKTFWIAALGVGVIALVVGYRKGGTASSSGGSGESGVDDYGPYTAVGYAGYPMAMMGTESDSAYYSSLLQENAAYYEGLLQEAQTDYESQLTEYKNDSDQRFLEAETEFKTALEENQAYYEELLGQYQEDLENMKSNVAVSSKNEKAMESLLKSQQEELEKSQALSQMMANSDLWHTTTDKGTKDSLHAANLAIANKYGFSYDEKSGTYKDGSGKTVYTTPLQNAVAKGTVQTTAAKKKT